MRTEKNESIVQSLVKIVNDITDKYSDILIQMAVMGNKREIANTKHSDNFLSEIDIELHLEYQTRLLEIMPSFIYASEEGPPQICPHHYQGLPEFIVVVDPLDSSELAVRGLCGYTHILVYSLQQQSPIVSLVGDLFHKIRLFYAFQDKSGYNRAFLMRADGRTLPIRSSQEKRLNQALVTNYLMRPRERFSKIAEQHAFLDSLSQADENGQEKGRIGVDFGSIGLCHVAANFTDAMVELAKGFKLWDLMPGHYILHSAGGIVTDLDGKVLPLNLNLQNLTDIEESMERRQKFVATGNPVLLKSILKTLV